MNYKRIYYEFIKDRCGKGTPKGYAERHHIKPQSVGGEGEASNILYLSASDHLFAHVLLARIYGGSLWSAVFMMSNQNKRITNGVCRRLYETSRIEHANRMKRLYTGRKLSSKQKKKLRETAIDRYKDESFRTRMKITCYENKERNKKISNAMKGNKYGENCVHTEAHKKKMSKLLSGRVFSEETKKKMSDGQLRRAKREKELGTNFKSDKHKQAIREANAGKLNVFNTETKEVSRMSCILYGRLKTLGHKLTTTRSFIYRDYLKSIS